MRTPLFGVHSVRPSSGYHLRSVTSGLKAVMRWSAASVRSKDLSVYLGGFKVSTWVSATALHAVLVVASCLGVDH